MSDSCEECKVENFAIENLKDCTLKNLKKVCKLLPECSSTEDVHYILTKDDTILYITIYLATCWVLLQPFRK